MQTDIHYSSSHMHVDLKSFVQCFITPWWITSMFSNVWYGYIHINRRTHYGLYVQTLITLSYVTSLCPSVTFRLLPSGLYSGKFTYQGMLYELSLFIFVLFGLFDATGIETAFRKHNFFLWKLKCGSQEIMCCREICKHCWGNERQTLLQFI